MPRNTRNSVKAGAAGSVLEKSVIEDRGTGTEVRELCWQFARSIAHSELTNVSPATSICFETTSGFVEG